MALIIHLPNKPGGNVDDLMDFIAGLIMINPNAIVEVTVTDGLWRRRTFTSRDDR